MRRLIIRKSMQGLLMLAAVSAIAFGLLASAGGDAVSDMGENPQVSAETLAELRLIYGLERPAAARYFDWATLAATGDLGESLTFRTPVAGLVMHRLWNTFLISGPAFILAAAVSFLMAFAAVRWPGKITGGAVELTVLVTASVPRMAISLFGLLMIFRAARPGSGAAKWLALVAVLAVPLIAVFLAQMHAGLRSAMQMDFVRFAEAKGLSRTDVIMRHAVREMLGPVLTVMGMAAGILIGGSVIAEAVLNWPGIGQLMVAAVRGRDIPLVMGIVLVTCAAVWASNLAADVLRAVNDKRLRAGDQ